MMEPFEDAARNPVCKPVASWKEQGGGVVGHTCSYVPGEVLHAAGLLPVRLRGIGTDSLQIGDAYFGPYICSFPKCLLQLAGEGRFSFLDGAVVTPGCDSMRRLFECWRKAGEDHPGIVPRFFHYLDAPHKVEPHGMAWFEEEIRRLIRALEAHFSVHITSEALLKSIRVYNKGRRLLARLEALRAADRFLVSGTEAFAVSVAGTVMPREEFNGCLEGFLDQVEERASADATARRPRLMVLGSISDDIGLIEILEEEGRAWVAAENLCFGVRREGLEIREHGDPVRALAEGYLGASACPRMFGRYKERLAWVVDTLERARIDGVVLQNIRFCDLHGSENSLFERDLESRGMPCLKIEREYGPLVETGRIRMRLQAFLERISA